ncbi:response regulator [Alkalimonas amylolytica]|uniref:Response regulator receiver domain-containing protein n=1 Tax=Alkalimonas amylolytica TaxID=152573 RepID=A0A1H3ZHA5_ALKAM|nr:response regulator [Alkalimonas amylolytica]SEA23035.1 Response regulator receiver domain-containing protein [Alkalimonas amylolytica]
MTTARVLLLDDDSYMLNAYQRMLRAAPYPCHFEQSCSQARQFLAEHPTELLLIDYLMPEQNGLDFCKGQSAWAMATRCYLLSGMETTSEMQQAVTQGLIQGILTKPITKAELLAFLHQQLS